MDEVSKVHILGRLSYLFVGYPVGAQADIALDCAGKEKWILQNDAEASP